MTQRIESALACVSPIERSTWIAMGMAVKSELGDAGFDLWDRWSRQAANYREKDARIAWRSFRNGGGITIRSLYHEARANGWKDRQTAQNAPQAAQIIRVVDDTKERERERQRAAKRAAAIVKQCRHELHAYLGLKGFPGMMGLVWENKGASLLVVPMYVDRQLVNVQLITPEGEKKFLAGGQAGGAEYTFDSKGMDVLCEGYATGLSVQKALGVLRIPHRVHVTFSAQNMVRIARGLRAGLVVADNDESGTGERVAKEIGWPYWISDRVGEDANDAHRRLGLFRLSQSLRSVIGGRIAA